MSEKIIALLRQIAMSSFLVEEDEQHWSEYGFGRHEDGQLWSFGNYDDVFADGRNKGLYENAKIAREILKELGLKRM